MGIPLAGGYEKRIRKPGKTRPLGPRVPLKWGGLGRPGDQGSRQASRQRPLGATSQQPGKGSVAAAATATATAAEATTTAAAAAVTAAAATTAVAATATAAAATATTGFSLVDPDHATHPLDILKFVDGLGFLGISGKLNKRKTALATRVPIEGQAALLQLPILGKQALEVFHFGIEGKITHVNCHERKTI